MKLRAPASNSTNPQETDCDREQQFQTHTRESVPITTLYIMNQWHESILRLPSKAITTLMLQDTLVNLQPSLFQQWFYTKKSTIQFGLVTYKRHLTRKSATFQQNPSTKKYEIQCAHTFLRRVMLCLHLQISGVICSSFVDSFLLVCWY